MFYKLKNDCFVRSYDELGYITSVGLFKDRVVNKTGSFFLSALSREPLTLDQLADSIAPHFVGVTIEEIKKDAEEFFGSFVDDGFLSSGYTVQDTLSADKGFTYCNVNSGLQQNDYRLDVLQSEHDTQSVLQDYFLERPHLHAFQIELTSRCNERCVHCYIPHKNKNTDIDPKLFYSVLDQLEKMGTLTLTLGGGEPMAHPDFLDFLKAAKSKDFYVVVLTNLTLLNDEIISALKEGCVSSVQTSLYSMIPEHHDAITAVPGSFEKTKAAIQLLIENNIPIQISCPTMKGNMNDFVDVLKWANEHKIRAYTDPSIMAMYDHNTTNLANRLTPDECRKIFLDILEYDTDYQKRVLSESFQAEIEKACFKPDDQFCGVGVSTCCMVANGNIYPCAGWQECVCGNLWERTLEDIWINSEKLNWLRGLRKKDIPECLDCNNQAFCSPCLVRFANESPTGDPLKVCTHFCDVAAVNKEVVIKWRNEKKTKEVAELILNHLKESDYKAGYYWPSNSIRLFRDGLSKDENQFFNDAMTLLIRQGYLIQESEKDKQVFLTEKGANRK